MKWSATSGVAVVDVVGGCGTSCFPEWRLQCRRLTLPTTSWVSWIHCIRVYWVKVACELTCILPEVLLTWAVYCVYQNLLLVCQALKNVCCGFFSHVCCGLSDIVQATLLSWRWPGHQSVDCWITLVSYWSAVTRWLTQPHWQFSSCEYESDAVTGPWVMWI